MRYYFLSFASHVGFLGACLVGVEDIADPKARAKLAIDEAWRLGINPGGEVLIADLSDAVPLDAMADVLPVVTKYLNRRLTRADCDAWDREVTDVAERLGYGRMDGHADYDEYAAAVADGRLATRNQDS